MKQETKHETNEQDSSLAGGQVGAGLGPEFRLWRLSAPSPLSAAPPPAPPARACLACPFRQQTTALQRPRSSRFPFRSPPARRPARSHASHRLVLRLIFACAKFGCARVASSSVEWQTWFVREPGWQTCHNWGATYTPETHQIFSPSQPRPELSHNANVTFTSQMQLLPEPWQTC